MAGPIDHQAAACAFPGSLTWVVEGPTLIGNTRCRAETVMPFNGYQTLQDSSDGRHDDRHDDFRGGGDDDDGASPRYHGAWNDYAARRDAICGLRKPRMAQKTIAAPRKNTLRNFTGFSLCILLPPWWGEHCNLSTRSCAIGQRLLDAEPSDIERGQDDQRQHRRDEEAAHDRKSHRPPEHRRSDRNKSEHR